MSDYPRITNFEQVILEPIDVGVKQALTEERMYYIRDSMRIEVEVDRMRKAFWFHLRSQVLSRTKRETWEFTERPTYLTWRHHLIDSLPHGSYRRRFLCYFWGIDDKKLGKTVHHIVSVKAGVTYPYADVPMPPDIGRGYPYISFHDDRA